MPITIKETFIDLDRRIDLLSRLGDYMCSDDSQWNEAKDRAARENPWFIPEFVELATSAIANEFLRKEKLLDWAKKYNLTEVNSSTSQPVNSTTNQPFNSSTNQPFNSSTNQPFNSSTNQLFNQSTNQPINHPVQAHPKLVGVVMAGNIPLVGFHDFLSILISGHRQMIKLSSKDKILLKHLVERLIEWDSRIAEYVLFNEMLKGCDAYIATGSNNTARYFEYYFSKYPHIIRRNRTSVAILDGKETNHQLEKLADDVYQYFGLGCRNVTNLYVPNGYDFSRLLETFKKYDHLIQFHKYGNNYDYQLALLILNRQLYMSNGSILLVESPSVFSPISRLNYEFYDVAPDLTVEGVKEDIQCVVGYSGIDFGQAQLPALCDYADGRDTLQFLLTL